MPVDSERLKTTLEELHRQLATVGDLDSEARSQLAAALQEIQTALQNKTNAENAPLMRRLGAAARHFEDSHPALAGTIGSLIDTLGRSGI